LLPLKNSQSSLSLSLSVISVPLTLMADLWSPQVALPDKVEQLLQKICKDQKQAPPRADVRQKLASLGEEAALGILREISASSIRKSLGGFILYMINKASSQRLAPVSPLCTPSSPSRPMFSPPQGTYLPKFCYLVL
jgi:hypothetical protein